MNFFQAMNEPKEVKKSEEKAKIDRREEAINKQKEKIAILEKKAQEEKTAEDLELERTANVTLSELFSDQIQEEENFGIRFPEEKVAIKKAQEELKAERTKVLDKINVLSNELAKEGTNIIPKSEQVAFELFENEIKNDKTISSRWKSRLEIFYNEIKLKVNELPIIGNPKKALALRDKLNNLYDSFDQIGNQLENLQDWGDYLINSALVERDYGQVRERLVSLQTYINRLENINNRIAKNEFGANDQKFKLQQEAVAQIVLKTAVDLMHFSEKFKKFEKVLTDNQVFKNTVQESLKAVQDTMNDLLNKKFSLPDYFKTENEVKQIAQDQTQYVKSFLKLEEFSNFGKLTNQLVKTLATQPGGVGVFANFPEYKKMKTYLDVIEGLDISDLVNQKELQDWEMDAFAQKVAETYSELAESLAERYDKLSKITPRTAKIKAELGYINDTYQKMVDGLETWLPIKQAFEYKIIVNSSLKGPKNEQEKIAQDNQTANTRSKEIAEASAQLAAFKKRLFDSKKPSEIVVLADFLKTYDEFAKKVVELLALVNDPATAPSRDTLKTMKQLLRLYKQIQASVESYGKTIHSFEDAPSIEAENELVKKYLDILNKQEALKKRIASFNNALLVVGQDGNAFFVDQIDNEYVKKLGNRDALITDEKIKSAVKDIRDAAKIEINVLVAIPQNIKKYQEQLFNTKIQFSGGSSEGQLPDDGSGGYDY